MLIVFAGLPGTGKTTIARQLAGQLGAVYLRIDSIEQSLLADCPGAADGPAGYCVARAVAADNLALGHGVVADGVNAAPQARSAWTALASQASVPCRWVEVVCSDAAEHRRRVEARRPDIAGHVLPGWNQIQAIQMPPLADSALLIDTAILSAQAAVDLVMAQWPQPDRRRHLP